MRVKGIIAILLPLLLLVLFVNVGLSNSSEPSVLQITRSSPLNDFPALDRTVRDASSVQHLYDAAYALPKISRGIQYCPIDVGLVYHLSFLRGTVSVQQVEMDTGGCQSIRLSEHDVRHLSESFLSLLAKAIGVSKSMLAPVPVGP